MDKDDAAGRKSGGEEGPPTERLTAEEGAPGLVEELLNIRVQQGKGDMGSPEMKRQPRRGTPGESPGRAGCRRPRARRPGWEQEDGTLHVGRF